MLKEYYKNTIADQIKEEKENANNNIEEDTKGTSYIEGPTVVYPYDEVTYKIVNASNGTWTVSNSKAAIKESATENEVLITITTGRSGDFKLIYTDDKDEEIVLDVTIESL